MCHSTLSHSHSFAFITIPVDAVSVFSLANRLRGNVYKYHANMFHALQIAMKMKCYCCEYTTSLPPIPCSMCWRQMVRYNGLDRQSPNRPTSSDLTYKIGNNSSVRAFLIVKSFLSRPSHASVLAMSGFTCTRRNATYSGTSRHHGLLFYCALPVSL